MPSLRRSLDEFLAESARYPGGLNLVFEVGMYSLSTDLEKIVGAFRNAGLSFEIVDGVAINAHLFLRHRSRSFVTRDIDILLRRSDLEQAALAAEQLGYRAKKMMGGYALIRPQQELGEAIHLLFVAEKSKSTQPLPHPDLHPEEKDFLGVRRRCGMVLQGIFGADVHKNFISRLFYLYI